METPPCMVQTLARSHNNVRAMKHHIIDRAKVEFRYSGYVVLYSWCTMGLGVVRI
jgi:hypothetical protein